MAIAVDRLFLINWSFQASRHALRLSSAVLQTEHYGTVDQSKTRNDLCVADALAKRYYDSNKKWFRRFSDEFPQKMQFTKMLTTLRNVT